MKFVVPWLLLSILALAGCAHHKSAGSAAKPAPKMIIAPETMLVGKVKKVNENARFVILNFPVGAMPGAGKRLDVYRGGLKMGEVKVTGPQQDDNTVADIVAGQAIEGDEVRGN